MNKDIYIIKQRVMDKLDTSREVSEAELLTYINEELEFFSRETCMTIKNRRSNRREVFNSIKRLDILQDILDDDTVTEIMINGYDSIFIERKGHLIRYDKSFESKERLEDIVQQIASKSNRIINETTPILDTRLSDGSRVNVVLSPVSIDGPTVTIRKFYDTPLTMARMIELNSINDEVATFLKRMVEERINIFISGGTGSGKTTFLNALSNYIPKGERLITIEDSAELQIQNVDNLVRLETRNANIEGKNAISIRDLIRTALRMRPDRIVIGEVRGEETIDLLQALNTGHSGSLSTGHSNSGRDMLERLTTMVLLGTDIPLLAVRGQIATAIDVIVHLKRYKDGSRKVDEIIEILGLEGDRIATNTLYKYEIRKSTTECVTGELRKYNDILSERIKAVYEG